MSDENLTRAEYLKILADLGQLYDKETEMTDQQQYEMAHDEAQDAYRTYERVQASADAAFAHYIRVRDKLKALKAKVVDVLV